MFRVQLDLGNASVGVPSQVILSCLKLTTKQPSQDVKMYLFLQSEEL